MSGDELFQKTDQNIEHSRQRIIFDKLVTAVGEGMWKGRQMIPTI